MIPMPNRGFAEWGEIFGSTVVATALLDRLLHHTIVVQIDDSSYRLRRHADLQPEPVRPADSRALPGAADPKRRGRPSKYGGADRQTAKMRFRKSDGFHFDAPGNLERH
jgi:hypothetical protein